MPLHFLTPFKCWLLGIMAYLKDHKAPFFKSDVFQGLYIGKTRGWVILYNGFDQRHSIIETMVRKPIISLADI